MLPVLQNLERNLLGSFLKPVTDSKVLPGAQGPCNCFISYSTSGTSSNSGCQSCPNSCYRKQTTPYNYKCFTCTTNCASCFGPGNCFRCSSGYYLSSMGTCIACTTPNCRTCNKTQVCSKCKPGFRLSGTQCTPCISGCDSCSSDTTCDDCSFGYSLDSKTKTCNKVSAVLGVIVFLCIFVLPYAVCIAIAVCICCCIAKASAPAPPLIVGGAPYAGGYANGPMGPGVGFTITQLWLGPHPSTAPLLLLLSHPVQW